MEGVFWVATALCRFNGLHFTADTQNSAYQDNPNG